MDNKLFINSLLYATLGAKGNIPDSKAKDIAIKASIGSLLPSASIAPFIVAQEMKKNVEENVVLQNEVNNSISAAQISGRIQKLYDNAKADGPDERVLNKIFSELLRAMFSNSHLQLLSTHSKKDIQQCIQVSLTLPDTGKFPGNMNAFSPPDSPTDPIPSPPGSPTAKVKSNKGQDI